MSTFIWARFEVKNCSLMDIKEKCTEVVAYTEEIIVHMFGPKSGIDTVRSRFLILYTCIRITISLLWEMQINLNCVDIFVFNFVVPLRIRAQ